MRRIWFSVVNFPASLDFDPYVNFPAGGAAVWPPLFDWSLAAVARVLVGPASQHMVEVVAAWAPPVLGACTVLATTWLARRVFSPAAGWAAGALLAALPAHVFYSALGEVDHHVAVGLFVLWWLGAALRFAGPPAALGGPRGAIGAGVAAAASLLLWPGSLLHLAVVQAALALQLLATREQADALARARGLAWLHAVAALALSPFCVGRSWEQFGPVSPLVLSNFQPLWFAAGAAALALAGALWRRPRLGATRARRVGSALGLVALGLAAALALVPGLAASLANAASWFQPDPFLQVISEMEPLLFPSGEFDASAAVESFSVLFWAYPLAAAWLGARAWRERRGEAGLVLAWSAVSCALALYQQRFCDVGAPAFALVIGPAAVEFVRAAGRLPARRLATAGAAALCAGLALSPYAATYLADLRISSAARRGEPLEYRAEVRERLVLQRVARWLASETPPSGGYLDPAVKPAYGVLSAWGHGHLLRYYGERPMVEDNFGPYVGETGFAAARAYYASADEASGAEIADRLGARYVVAAPQGSGQGWPQRDSLARRLALVPGRPLTPFSRHRLVFFADDADLARGPKRAPWSVAVYEVVRGARVVGRAPGAGLVGFELELPALALRWRAGAVVDASGAYEIRLPHPSEAPYRVRAGEREAAFSLSEADVREGRTVEGPSFAP
jgi:dolichyl-diphosphooligosaccharide--protein glycosyltransferase